MSKSGVPQRQGNTLKASAEQVLAARITPPNFGFRPVATRALAALLQSQALPKLVSVCAAPGYGKTVLLSRLYEELTQRGQACLWVTLDDRDSDLSTLLYLIRAAVDHSALLAGNAQDTTVPPFVVREASADELLAQLNRLPNGTVLFIDNLGYCRAPELPVLLDCLVFGTSPGLHLVLSSTEQIPVDAVRAKLERGALELGANQLSFDRLSTTHLLGEAGLPPPTDDLLDRIQAQTEGWPTAVRLLQVLMSSEAHGPDPGATDVPGQALARFSGDHKDIARWLTRRVLVGFEPALVRFMVEMALVREFSGELAAHMTGSAEAAVWLDKLITRNVLIFPLDRDRRWLRFHTLLREFLLAEGREQLPAAHRHALLERAARWHAQEGHDAVAVGIALDAHAIELSQKLLDRLGSVVAGDQGRMVTYIQWVDRLMSIGGKLSVETHGWYVWALCNNLQYERARNALDQLDGRVREGGEVSGASQEQQHRQRFLRIVANLYLDRLYETHDGAVGWLNDGGPRDALSDAVTAGIAGLTEIDLGELAEARAHMALSEAVMERGTSTWVRAWVGIVWSCLELAEARPQAADQRLQEIRRLVAQSLGEDASVVNTIDFVHARALLDLGRISQARQLAQRGLDRASHHGILLTAELGLSACAALWTGEAEDALAPAVVEKVGYSYPARLHRLLAASRIRRSLQLGRHDEAQRLAARSRLGEELTASDRAAAVPARGDWLLAGIELQIANGALDAARDAIELQLREAQRQGRQRDRVELLLASTELYLRHRLEAKALRSFSLAIVAAASGKLLYPFLSRQAILAPLLTAGRAKVMGLIQPAELALLDRLQAHLTPAVSATGEPGEPAPSSLSAEALSSRERQLLGLVDQGLNNQQIADRLTISLPTVKWHCHNLYAKLEVSSRSAALAKARALGLLQR